MSQDDKVQFKAHARDDSAGTTENQFVVIDALANDRGDPATVWSLDQNDPTNSVFFAELPSGAIVQTNAIRTHVVYKPGTGWDYLAEGETATDSFTYTIRLADGSFSTATIDILITGVNDPAILSYAIAQLTEGDDAEDLSTSGTLTISDVDGPELFVAGTQEGAYGTFTIEEDGDWTYTSYSAHDEFTDGKTYGDAFTVSAADGTTTWVFIEMTGTADGPEMMGAHMNPDFAAFA